MPGAHCQDLLWCFRKIVVNHCPDNTINRISNHIQKVFHHADIFIRDNDLSEKLLNQIDFIVLLDCPDKVFFRIKELNQSLLLYFPVFRRHGIDFTILCPFQNQAVQDNLIRGIEVAVVCIAGYPGFFTNHGYGNVLLALQQFIIGNSNAFFGTVWTRIRKKAGLPPLACLV